MRNDCLKQRSLGKGPGGEPPTPQEGLATAQMRGPIRWQSLVAPGRCAEKVCFTKTNPIFWWGEIRVNHWRKAVCAISGWFLNWVRFEKRTGVTGCFLTLNARLVTQNDAIWLRSVPLWIDGKVWKVRSHLRTDSRSLRQPLAEGKQAKSLSTCGIKGSQRSRSAFRGGWSSANHRFLGRSNPNIGRIIRVTEALFEYQASLWHLSLCPQNGCRPPAISFTMARR